MFKRSFTDFDEFANHAQRWDLELTQMDAGQFHAELMQIGIGDVQISEARFCSGRIIKHGGAPPKGLRTIVVPAAGDFSFVWRGARIDANCLMIFPQGTEFDGVSKDNFHVFTCSFPESLLEDVACSLGIAVLDDLNREVVQCEERQMSVLRRLLRQLCTRVCSDKTLLRSTEFVEGVTSDLPQLLVSTATMSGHESARSISATKRMRVLQCAEDYIDRRSGDELTVGEVCEAVQASVRTLQLAFSERYGVSPKAYIRAIRLNQARKQLRKADPQDQKVTDIANSCGFWHMGQFAADYRRQFGELPSATLHNGKRSPSIPVEVCELGNDRNDRRDRPTRFQLSMS